MNLNFSFKQQSKQNKNMGRESLFWFSLFVVGHCVLSYSRTCCSQNNFCPYTQSSGPCTLHSSNTTSCSHSSRCGHHPGCHTTSCYASCSKSQCTSMKNNEYINSKKAFQSNANLPFANSPGYTVNKFEHVQGTRDRAREGVGFTV